MVENPLPLVIAHFLEKNLERITPDSHSPNYRGIVLDPREGITIPSERARTRKIMKKLLFLIAFLAAGSSLSAMVRAGVDVGPGPVYYDGYYYSDDWYGPGYYYGVYYSDYPAYYAWRRRYYYGGPYYYRYRYYDGYRHGHHHKKKH